MVTVNMKDFKKAVRIAKMSISPKVKPVLGCILINCDGDKLTMSSTNLDQYMTQSIPLSRKGEMSPVLIPWENINEALKGKKTENFLSINQSDSDVSFNFGNTSITVKTFDGEDQEFPNYPDGEPVWIIDLQAPALAGCIRKVYYARSLDNIRFTLNGVLLESCPEGVNIAATDGNRMSVCNLTKEEKPEYKAIMQTNFCKTLLTVCDSGQVKVGVVPSKDGNGASYTVVQGQEWSVISRTIDGQFPLYEKIIPKQQDYGVLLKKRVLCDTLSGFTGMNDVILSRCEKGMKIFCDNAEAVIRDVDTSAMATWRCSTKYLMEMLFAVDSEWVLIQTSTTLLMIKDENSTHILSGISSKDYYICFFCGKKYEIEEGVNENKEVCSEDCEKALETAKENAKLLNEKHQTISVKKTRVTLKGLLERN